MISPNELRRKTLELAIKTNNGHIASAFSIIEILTVIYEIIEKDDKFILSKGHGCLALYAKLIEKGFNPTLSGHPDIDVKNGIECTTGSLGHGLPIAVGMALAKKLKGRNGKVFVLLGDGECQEGTTWESLMVASHHKLNNLVVIIDRNLLQAIGKTEEVLALNGLYGKLLAFGCYPMEIDGHNELEIHRAIHHEHPLLFNCPKVIIANTVKGKGMPFAEGQLDWHNRLPDEQQIKELMEKLK